MEAINDGQLVRQHNPNLVVKIAATEGSTNLIQRVHEYYYGQKIRCPSKYVSRKHCEIYRRDSVYWIKDLGSANGTYLNGVKLLEGKEREIRFGDFIGVGVSHLDTDVDVTLPEYYVFLFRKEELEVIDLDDDNEEVPLHHVEAVENAPAEPKDDSDDDDIKIIEDNVSNQSSVQSNKSSSSENSPRKSMPPPPPPPIISRPVVSKKSSKTSSKSTPTSEPPSSTTPSKYTLNGEHKKQQTPSPTSSKTKLAAINGSVGFKPEQQQQNPSPTSSKIKLAAINGSVGFKPEQQQQNPSPTSSKIKLADINGSVGFKQKQQQIPSPSFSMSKLADKNGSVGVKQEQQQQHVTSPSPSTSDINGSDRSVDCKNKRHQQFDHREPPVKRTKQDRKASSSDDSSDGLGDVDAKVEDISCKRRSGIYSGISSEDSSSEENNINDDKPAWRNLSREPDVIEMKKTNGKHLDAPTYKRPPPPLDISDSDNDDCKDEEEEKRCKYDEQKREALSRKCVIKLESVIKYDGRYTLRQDIHEMFRRECRRRMQADFTLSLEQNGLYEQPASMNNLGENDRDLKRERKSSSSDTNDDDVSMHESTRDQNEQTHFYEDVEDMDVNVEDDDDEDIEMNDLPHEFEEDHHSFEIEKPAAVPTVSKPEYPVTAKPNVAKRGIQLLHDAPLPRFAAIAQSKFAPFKSPIPVTAPKSQKVKSRINEPPLVSPSMTREEQKQARSQKLKEMAELQKQQERQEKESSPACSFKKAPQPAKIKVTSRNRNEGLMESIIESKSKTTEPVPEKTGDANGENHEQTTTAKDNAPQITLEDPRLAKDTSSRVQPREDPRLNNNTVGIKNMHQPVAHTSSILRGPPNVASKSQNGPSILKPGAKVNFSPPVGIGKVNYKEKHPSAADISKAHAPTQHFQVLDDDIYKRILMWRPEWLEEQKKQKESGGKDKEPPLLRAKENMALTLKRYENYDAYFKIYYPLLLSEIWATISSDYFKSKTNDTNSRNNFSSGKQLEYKVTIESTERVSYCFLARQKRGNDKSNEDEWVNVRYHTWVQNLGDIDYKKDLVILQMNGRDRKTGKAATKLVFGFAWDSSKKYDPINKTQDCDVRLKKKFGTGNGYRFTEVLVCRFGDNFVADKKELAQVTRIHNIATKLREFRVLNTLKSFTLAPHIIVPPQDPRHTWQTWLNKNSNMPTEHLISICKKLNLEQKCVVNNISQRITSDNPQLMLLHGPPGTGKTTTIVALVLQLLVSYRKRMPSKDHRILICTPSNAAIDEIMRRLIREINVLPNTTLGGSRNMINIVRVGEGYTSELEQYAVRAKVKKMDEDKSTASSIVAEITNVTDEIQELNEEIAKIKSEPTHANYSIRLESVLSKRKQAEARKMALQKDYDTAKNMTSSSDDNQQKSALIIKNSHVICSTLSASSTSVMKAAVRTMQGEKSFVCCIIDEASQTTEPETLLPLVLGIDKVLLVGDPHQLGATVLSNLAEEKNYGQSLFSRHYHFYKRSTANPVMLLKRQYRMHPDIGHWPNVYFYESQLQNQYNHPPRSSGYPLRPYYFLNLSSGREHSEKVGQIENAVEVEMVKALIDTVNEMLLPSNFTWTVGIITPYSAQKQSLRRAFERQAFKSFKSFEIDTVDGFQGQERDIIILSCVRTEATGFLKSPNRLNVALTRAKHSLFIIGDARCLAKENMWNCLIKDAAGNNNKFDVDPDFKHNLKILKTQLHNNLKKKTD